MIALEITREMKLEFLSEINLLDNYQLALRYLEFSVFVQKIWSDIDDWDSEKYDILTQELQRRYLKKFLHEENYNQWMDKCYYEYEMSRY